MIKIENVLFAIVTATLLTGCCWTDHSDTIKEVAEPMLKELEAFYKTNKRFPNTKERDVMLEKSGCKMKGDVCMFDGKELTIKSEETLTNGYDVKINYMKDNESKASCGFGLYSDGDLSTLICSKRFCLELRQ